MAGDANYPNVSLLLHADGANNSTVFTDTSPNPKTVTVVSGAKISTAESKFGGSSILLNGTSDSLVLPDSADFNIGSGNFTIEGWVRYTGTPAGEICCDNNGNFRLSMQGGKFRGSIYHSTFLHTPVAFTPVANTWYHVALVLDASLLRLFVDGVQQSSVSRGGASLANASGFSIGKYGTSAFSYFNGYIDDFRFTRAALYSGTFTPHTVAHLDYAAQVSGTVLDSSAAGAARIVRAYRRDTGAMVGSTTSDGSTGAYTVNCTSTQEVTVVCLDDSGGTLENDLVARVIPA